MLRFNPEHRPSASRLLKSSLFDKVRSPSKEQTPSHKVKLEREKGIVYDYKQQKVVSDHNMIFVLAEELKKAKIEL